MIPPLLSRRDAAGRSAGTLLRRAAAVVCACAVTFAASGCAKPRAEGLVAGPALEVPLPPPRVLAPVELEGASVTAGAPPAAAPEVVADPPSTNAGNQSAAKPPPAPPAEAAASQPPAAEAEPPRAEVRVVPSVEDIALEKEYQTASSNARRDLARVGVDLQRLSANAREHYEQARRHLNLAEGHYRERSLEHAVHYARAAATVASLLLTTR